MSQTNAAAYPMDVSFALAALRRYAWVVLVCSLAGIVIALSLGLLNRGNFESQVVLAVRPTTGGNVFYTDTEAYVAGQVIQLRSEALAEVTAELLRDTEGLDISGADVQRIVTVKQRPFTEIVSVVAEGDDADLVKGVVVAHVDAYFAGIPTAIIDEERQEALRAEATELTRELASLDDRVEAAMAPYVADFVINGGTTDERIPSPEMIVPADMSRRVLVQAELEQIGAALIELEANSRVQTNTTILAEAPPSSVALPLRLNPGPAAAIPTGAFVGMMGALFAARISARPRTEHA